MWRSVLIGVLTSAAMAAAPAAQSDADKGFEQTIRFLEERTRSDPLDFIALNHLGGCYLQRLSETSDLHFLQLAQRVAKQSLASAPAEANPGGLAILARASLGAHDFIAARDAAERLLQLAPDKSYPHEILGDALLELGEYEMARAEYTQMEDLASGTVNTETRLSQQAWLNGEVDAAREHLTAALSRAQSLGPAAGHSVAWCRVQLGDVAFASGDYAGAEQHFRAATQAAPRYILGWGGLAKSRAAQGDRTAAIAHYTHALNIQPDIGLLAALSDLYELEGQPAKAKEQSALIDILADSAQKLGVGPDRRLITYWANHQANPQRTYEAAKANYAGRRGVRDADVLAWAALQAGKLDEASEAAEQALRLKTPDPLLFYHAGMIAATRSDRVNAIAHLQRALALSPRFDPVHAPRAKAMLDQLMPAANDGSLPK